MDYAPEWSDVRRFSKSPFDSVYLFTLRNSGGKARTSPTEAAPFVLTSYPCASRLWDMEPPMGAGENINESRGGPGRNHFETCRALARRSVFLAALLLGF